MLWTIVSSDAKRNPPAGSEPAMAIKKGGLDELLAGADGKDVFGKNGFHRFFSICLRVRIRDDGTVRNKAMHIDLGVRPDGTKVVPGLWIE
jgi:Transposase, Mutator family